MQVVILSAGAAAGQGVTALLTAKWLGASDRGILAVAQSISLLLVLVGGLGLIQATRMLLANEASGVTLQLHGRLSTQLMVLQLILAATVGVASFSNLTMSSGWFPLSCLVVMSVAGLRAALTREALHGLGWHRAASGLEMSASFVALVTISLAYARNSLTLNLALGALAMAALTQSALQQLVLRRATRGTRDQTPSASWTQDLLKSRRVFALCLPALVAALGMALATRMDRLLLAYFANDKTVGVYATAATLADLPWILPVAMSPMIVRQVAQSRSMKHHASWWRRVVVATVALSLVVFVMGGYLMEVFLGGDFGGNLSLFAVLLLGSVAIASLQVDLAACNGIGDLKSSAVSAIWGAAVGVASYIVLIRIFGLMGCGYATVVTYSTMAIIARVRLRSSATYRQTRKMNSQWA